LHFVCLDKRLSQWLGADITFFSILGVDKGTCLAYGVDFEACVCVYLGRCCGHDGVVVVVPVIVDEYRRLGAVTGASQVEDLGTLFWDRSSISVAREGHLFYGPSFGSSQCSDGDMVGPGVVFTRSGSLLSDVVIETLACEFGLEWFNISIFLKVVNHFSPQLCVE
jgi:hypothetical protein